MVSVETSLSLTFTGANCESVSSPPCFGDQQHYCQRGHTPQQVSLRQRLLGKLRNSGRKSNIEFFNLMFGNGLKEREAILDDWNWDYCICKEKNEN